MSEAPTVYVASIYAGSLLETLTMAHAFHTSGTGPEWERHCLIRARDQFVQLSAAMAAVDARLAVLGGEEAARQAGRGG